MPSLGTQPRKRSRLLAHALDTLPCSLAAVPPTRMRHALRGTASHRRSIVPSTPAGRLAARCGRGRSRYTPGALPSAGPPATIAVAAGSWLLARHGLVLHIEY